MRCEECRALILAGEVDRNVSRHLEGCRSCREERSSMEAHAAILGDASLWEEPPEALTDQVVGLVSGFGSGRRMPRRLAWLAAAVVVLVVGVGSLFRLSAPDWEVELPGTSLAPGAVGTVVGWNTQSGTRMILEVEGLDPAPDGFFYEFWLSEGPIHISAGTFTDAHRVELWSAVSRADFPRLWVTLEPVDEDESPTRQTVLDTG